MEAVIWAVSGSYSDPLHKQLNEVQLEPPLKEDLLSALEFGANVEPGTVQELVLVVVVRA